MENVDADKSEKAHLQKGRSEKKDQHICCFAISSPNAYKSASVSHRSIFYFVNLGKINFNGII